MNYRTFLQQFLLIPDVGEYVFECRAISIRNAFCVVKSIRQDADGVLRFEAASAGPADLGWYFPLEARHREDYSIEYTFRALLIFKLLGYDF